MRRLFTTLSVLLIILALPSPSSATESALTASPAILESILDPTTPTVTTVTIQNNTNFPLPIKGSVSAFLATESIPDPAKDLYNASRWFTLDPADFILQPGEQKPIKVTITPPPKAEPGGHYATIFFRPLIPEGVVSPTASISLARIGVLALLIMPGDITESLESQTLRAPTFQAFGPIKYWHSLTNNGSVHLLPKSTLTVKNIWGKVVHSSALDPSLILPHTTKDNSIVWETTWGFGPYSAEITTEYGTMHPHLTSNSTTTWLIPWSVILILLVLLTFIYKIFIVNRRRLALAIRVLRGTYESPENFEKITRHHPRSHAGPTPSRDSLKSVKRRSRRELNRGQGRPL